MEFTLYGSSQSLRGRMQWEPQRDGHPDAQPKLFFVIPLLSPLPAGILGASMDRKNGVGIGEFITTVTHASRW